MLGQPAFASTCLTATLERDGYCRVPGAYMLDGLSSPSGSWSAFAASWHDLEPDLFMGDGGRYRYRRHATYTLKPGGLLTRNAARPHRQAVKFNRLNGGIERWFSPIVPSIAEGSVMLALVSICTQVFSLHSAETWFIEAHQFRITASSELGKPTPEGLHRDGVDYVFISLIERHNISGGVTRLVSADAPTKSQLVELARPCDSLFLIDTKVKHEVSPVRAVADDDMAYRDVLVLTFAKSIASI